MLYPFTSCLSGLFVEDERRVTKKKSLVCGSDDKELTKYINSDLLQSEEGRSLLRVKVKMTKAEAARLLLKCKDGGLLDFKDVAREMVNIPVNRVQVIIPSSTFGTQTKTTSPLHSIPEE